MWTNIVEGTGHGLQYGTCALHAGCLKLQIYTLIVFPLQQLLNELPPIFLYKYIACRFVTNVQYLVECETLGDLFPPVTF